jgi:hypothetical protein
MEAIKIYDKVANDLAKLEPSVVFCCKMLYSKKAMELYKANPIPEIAAQVKAKVLELQSLKISYDIKISDIKLLIENYVSGVFARAVTTDQLIDSDSYSCSILFMFSYYIIEILSIVELLTPDWKNRRILIIRKILSCKSNLYCTLP